MRQFIARAKPAIASVATSVGMFHIGSRLVGRNVIRVLNYHATPAAHAAGLEAQLLFYKQHFTPAGPQDLEACLDGRFTSDRAGILITFDDGYRSNYDVAAPLLERHGFRGFFFLPTGWIEETRLQADARFEGLENVEPEPCMSWEEARDLQRRGHMIGCHTRTHVRLADHLTPDQLHDEISAARRDMERSLQSPVEDFCWVGGEEWSYGLDAFDVIMSEGYKRVFMTNFSPVDGNTAPWWIQRGNVEADWPLSLVKLCLSGAMDLAYAPKRRRLARKLLADRLGPNGRNPRAGELTPGQSAETEQLPAR